MKKASSPDTLLTHRPGWRGCGAIVDLPDWPTGGFCGEVGVICLDCHVSEFGKVDSRRWFAWFNYARMKMREIAAVAVDSASGQAQRIAATWLRDFEIDLAVAKKIDLAVAKKEEDKK